MNPTFATPYNLPVTKDHEDRVKLELLRAGVTKYGLFKSESRYLPRVILPNEHIGGVVYGQSPVGSVMLVATDERILYIDRKPLFNVVDEISYGVVSGCRVSQQGPFTAVVLHTRIQNFTLKYVNPTCARIFEDYIALRCIDSTFPYKSVYNNIY
ncbi:MAG TPA: PH domain-containing protein [Candidatus Saccharimonadales bacterium]|nr:PH domain-containing protein [Candidatus Saccharimonadales bacterium]